MAHPWAVQLATVRVELATAIVDGNGATAATREQEDEHDQREGEDAEQYPRPWGCFLGALL